MSTHVIQGYILIIIALAASASISAPAPAAVADSVRLGMPFFEGASLTFCPDWWGNTSHPWMSRGRDAEAIRIIAAHTHHQHGCLHAGGIIKGNTSPDPYMLLEGNHVDLYGAALLWRQGSDNASGVVYLYPHARDDLCIRGRRADFVQRSIFEAFRLDLWLATVGFQIVLASIMRFVFNVSFGHAALMVTETFLTGTCDRRHRRLRVFGAVFSLIVLNSFSGGFTSFLTVPKRGPEIDTLEEADSAYQRIYARGHVQGTFKSYMGSEDILLRIGAKLSGGTLNSELIDELSAGTSAFLDTDVAFEGMIREELSEFLTSRENVPVFRKIPECVFTPGYVSFPVRKDWKNVDRYDTLLQRLVAFGIIDKITQDGFKNMTMKQSDYLNYLNDAYKLKRSREKLSLQHFREAFLIIGVGVSLATISLIIETSTNFFDEHYIG